MKFQITNSSVVKLVWMNSMLVLMNCCKKENVRFLKEILSKFGKTTVFFFGYRLSYNHPNELIPIGKEPSEIGLQIYRRNQEKIVALRLPRLKGELV